jgi:hypothetical protein
VDEESFAYLRPRHGINEMLSLHPLAAMPRVGVAWDFYLLSDLADPTFPPHKLYLFLNAFQVPAAQRQAIHDRLRRDAATAVWVYAAGFYGDDASGPEGMARLTGIQVRQRDWDGPLWVEKSEQGSRGAGEAKSPITLGTLGTLGTLDTSGVAGSDVAITPAFVVDDPDAEAVGQLRGSEEVGLALQAMDGWMSVYCAAPLLTPALLRNLARAAGGHVYLDTGDALSVDDRFLCVHAATDGHKTLHLRAPATVQDAMSGAVLAEQATTVTLPMKRGETRLLELR